MFQNAIHWGNTFDVSFLPTSSLFGFSFLRNIWSQIADIFPVSEIQGHEGDFP